MGTQQASAASVPAQEQHESADLRARKAQRLRSVGGDPAASRHQPAAGAGLLFVAFDFVALKQPM